MRALVTGGAGFIGSHLCDLLRRERHDVTALLRPGESRQNIEHLDATVVECDVLDQARLDRLVPECDVVYHLAARTDLDGNAPADYDVNTRGTENVLRTAEARRVERFVLYSSMLAVPLTRRSEPVDESFDGANHTAYGRSKREAERVVAAGGVPWTVIRPTLVFGPRERSTMRAFARAVQRRQFRLIGRDVPQSYVYVKNLVHATYQASLAPQAAGEGFFVSDRRPYTLAEFAQAAAGALGVPLARTRVPKSLAMLAAWALWTYGQICRVRVPLFPSRVRTLTTPYVYSIEKARRVFDYDPPYELVEAWRETADWYLRNPTDTDSRRDSETRRIKP